MIGKSVALVVGTIALALGIWLALSQKQSGPLIDENTGVAYPQAREIGEFRLTDYDDQPLDQNSLAGKWWLVYFGFTYCPDACPTALNDLKQTLSLVDVDLREKIGVLFISVDPQRDTPQRLKEYVTWFDADNLAATGDEQVLQDLATRVGVVFFVPENPGDENYVVDHSTSILLWDPDVNLKAVFRAPHDPGKLATAVEEIVSQG